MSVLKQLSLALVVSLTDVHITDSVLTEQPMKLHRPLSQQLNSSTKPATSVMPQARNTASHGLHFVVTSVTDPRCITMAMTRRTDVGNIVFAFSIC